jgi:hypothetical protein
MKITLMMIIGWAMVIQGCARTSSLVRSYPRQEVTRPRTAPPLVPAQAFITDISMNGLTVIGSRGQALETAARLHQQLSQRGIVNEIHLFPFGKGQPWQKLSTRLRVLFPLGLTTRQQREVRAVMICSLGKRSDRGGGKTSGRPSLQ